jgi:hypothetical protein
MTTYVCRLESFFQWIACTVVTVALFSRQSSSRCIQASRLALFPGMRQHTSWNPSARSLEEETLDENQTFVQCVTTFFIIWMKVWNFGYARINVQWNRLDKMFPNLPFSSFGSRSLKTFKWSHTFIQSLFFWGPGSMILKIFSAKNLAKKWRFRPETKLSYAKIWS